MNQTENAAAQISCGDREYPAEHAQALIVAGGASHQDPGAVETSQQHKRPEQQYE